MGRYSSTTDVPVYRSQEELQTILKKWGAVGFVFGEDNGAAFVWFRTQERQIRVSVALPDKESKEFTKTPSLGRSRSDEAAFKAWDQACRQRWRALVLYIKALLVAVEEGIVTFEKAFLSHVVLPDGSTVGDWSEKAIQEVYALGTMPKLLPGGAS